MTGRETQQPSRRPIVYCLIPHELADKLHEPLRRHFRDDPSVEVIVERRTRERRQARERRAPQGEQPQADRRRIRAASGRRAGARRAALVAVDGPPLPRRLRPYAEQLAFTERLEPASEQIEDHDTAQLVNRFQSGEPDAFETLYMRYFGRVYSYLRVLLNDEHEAEDVSQQVFTKVFEALHRYERRAQPFRAWLFTVVRNQAIDQLRGSRGLELQEPEEIDRRREPVEDDDGFSTGFDWITDRELVLFVERLPLAQRQVLVLRYMLDLTYREIAEILGRSPTDVRSLQHRAMRFLRGRLTAVGRGPGGRGRARLRVYRKQAPVLRMRRFALLP